MPPKKSEPPPTRGIMEDLHRQISSGELQPGDRLPSTRELAAHYGVAEKTVYRAIALMKAAGEVEARQGKGVFVRGNHPLEWHLHRFERGDRRDSPEAGLDDWQAAAIEQGRTPSQDTPQVSVEPAPADIAGWLKVKPGAFVVARRRIRRVDGEPFQLADSWFPPQIALDSPLMEERDVTMPGGILAAIGHPQRYLRDEISSWPPTSPSEAERLELPDGVGTPVTRHVRIGYDQSRQPIRVMVTVAPGHLNRLIYEMEV